jgi:uncharacterized delta-60 repeat protein
MAFTRCAWRTSRHALVILLAGGILAPAASAAPGDLDSGFASAGIFTGNFQTVFPPESDDEAVAVDSQGRVLLASTHVVNPGDNTGRDIKVVRLTALGAVDTSFGSGGTATLAFPGVTDVYAAGLRVDSLDRVVVLGADLTTAGLAHAALARLTTSGDPDMSFNSSGYLVSGLPGGISPTPTDLAIDSTGALLVSATGTATGCTSSCTTTGLVARFTAAGALDTGYGAHAGWAQVGDSGIRAEAVVALPGGGSYATGYDFLKLIVERLTAGGALDTTFNPSGGTPGVASTDLNKAALDIMSDYGLAVDATGRPIILGQFTVNSPSAARPVAARFTVDGAADPTFGTGTPATGAVLLPSSINGRFTGGAVQNDGKILGVGVGSGPSATNNDVMLARLTDAGELDTTFAPSSSVPGVAFTAFEDTAGGYGVALSAGGALVPGFHRTNAPFGYVPLVLRYLTGDTGAPPPTTTTPPPPTTPPPTTTPPLTSAQLLLGCSGHRLTLTDVLQRGHRVILNGVADSTLVGKPVDVVFAGRKRVAHTIIKADGTFAATAPLPPAKIRATNKARYRAQSGGQRSLDLKLTRRLILQPPTSANGKVTIVGQVLRPLAKPIATIAVQQQVTCTRRVTVAHLRPNSSGRFRFTFAAPAGQTAAVYRLATQVRKTARRLRTFPTFSLPEPVDIH